MENLINEAQEQETILMTSGEADWEITDASEEPLWKAYIEKGARVKIIVGPVISVDLSRGANRSKGNPFLRLAAKSALTLYAAPMRQIRHLRILGERKVLVEDYHEGLATKKERTSRVIESRDIARKCAYDFDQDIKAFQCKGICGDFSNGHRIICLTKGEIRHLKEALKDPAISVDFLNIEASTYHAIMNVFKKPGRLYDFLTFDKTMALLQLLNLWQPEMALGYHN